MEDLFGLVGHQIESRYAVDAVVAAGGFGVVYHATHAALGSPVAVKVLKTPDTLPEHLRGAYGEQFRAEAKIIAALQHPAIVRVLDYGVLVFANGYQAPWMALEWIDGATLAKDLDARRGAGGRSPRECIELLTPVLEALALAHAKGIAHRDIKPANLMLPALDPAFASVQGARASRSAAPRLRLLDFGIAKVVAEADGPASGQTHTASAMAAYSPRYAAPEQASGTRTGPWTDVHALGLLLTELLVDAAPYPADKMELQIQTMAARRPTPATFGVDVGAWEPVLAKALALRPAERYANAGGRGAGGPPDCSVTPHGARARARAAGGGRARGREHHGAGLQRAGRGGAPSRALALGRGGGVRGRRRHRARRLERHFARTSLHGARRAARDERDPRGQPRAAVAPRAAPRP